ncbi:FxSxx-COOH system tetratricopeptide repeat protein [Streptomyces sp. NPDC002574]|uniref:FxSxx-COOH system tetratricopeptide repeat protein n=1 Tax=Streptomyces sp. NPDC002574 TaxID=3364652 RepID=UPI0036A24760
MRVHGVRPGRELAVLLSVTSRIEPELIRAVRVVAAPRLDVGAESDLWFGELVDQRGAGYITLREELLPELRQELAGLLEESPPGAPVHKLEEAISRVHGGRSPALLAEERVTWLAVARPRDADTQISAVLQPALRALVEEGREGIARWFVDAWRRFPEAVRTSTVGWQLATLSFARFPARAVSLDQPARLTLADLGPIAGQLPAVRLPVRRDGVRIVLGEGARGPGGFALTVPDSDPRILELVVGTSTRTVLVGPGETVEEWVGPDSVRLVSADGAVYELPAGREPGRGATSEHITVSYAGFHRPWAAWIAHQLEQVGLRTTMLRWDPGSEGRLADMLSDLLRVPGRLLLVLDDSYFRLGPRTGEEWTSALREVVPPNADRLAAVSVANEALPAGVAALRPAGLHGLAAAEARRRILRRLDIDPVVTAAAEGDVNAPRYPDDPPEIRRIPRRNERFTGRDKILEDLHDRLTAGGNEGARCALHGISGVGKSQIAQEYSHRFGNAYDVVYWVSANYRGTAREQLAQLAEHLGLSVGQEIGDRIRAVQEALRTGRPHERWLLVFDGADFMDQIEDLIPEGRGHVLLTTLTRDWSAAGRAEEIEVPPFLREESAAYALRRAPRLTPGEADDLADAVEDLPLLLAQTAAWLDTNPMPVREYVALIRRGEPDQVGIGIGENYPMSFQTSWSITLNTLRERAPGAAELLKLLAFFSPDAIPVRLIQSARAPDLPEHLAALAADPIGWPTALRRLSEATAVRLDQETVADTVQMHRLYHGFLRNDLSEDEGVALSATACRILARADPRMPTEPGVWHRYAELVPHLTYSGALESDDEEVQDLVVNCMNYLRTCGEYQTGLTLCEEALARWHGRIPPTRRVMLLATTLHTNLLRRSGRYREAEAVGRSVVLAFADRAPDDPDLLTARNALGGALLAQGRFHEAHELYEDMHRHNQRTFGAENPRTLQARENLGLALGLLGRYEAALELYDENARVRTRLYRGDHPDTLRSVLDATRMLRLLGRYTEAMPRQELNVRLHRRRLGPNNPETLRAEHNLALCMRRQGDLTGAEALMSSVVARCVQVQGLRHPETLMVQADLAALTREQGNLDESRELSERVAERYRELVGEDHPYTIGTYGNTGLVLWEYGERDAALAIAERVLVGMRRAVGEDHPWVLGCALNASGARHLAGHEEDALELSRGNLRQAVRTLGGTHPLTLSCKAALADDLRTLRRAEEAGELEREALQQLTDTLSAQHPHTMSVRRRERLHWDFEPQPI